MNQIYKNKRKFKMTWRDNMSIAEEYQITPYSEADYT
jgi:hypothetical protein